jgi:hypothetical protein
MTPRSAIAGAAIGPCALKRDDVVRFAFKSANTFALSPISSPAAMPQTRRRRQMTDFSHATNIGLIALYLADHEPGDYGDCSINDPIVSVLDDGGTAAALVAALSRMSRERAAGIAAQLMMIGPERIRLITLNGESIIEAQQ